MNEAPSLVKQFIIEMDIVNGTVDYKNPDGLTSIQVLGMIEFAKVLITKELIDEE